MWVRVQWRVSTEKGWANRGHEHKSVWVEVETEDLNCVYKALKEAGIAVHNAPTIIDLSLTKPGNIT